MSTLDAFAREVLAGLEAADMRRSAQVTARTSFPTVEREGRRLISFSCNDYLGLSDHAEVVAAARRTLDAMGFGAGASRLVTGEHPLHAALEGQLAACKETEAALVFGSGYLANIGIISAVMGEGDLILADKLSHSCMLTGAQVSGARLLRFAHNDPEHAGRLLAAHRGAHRHCLIMTEGVFSMDGDLAPLPELAALASSYDSWLLTDDAHALGVVGGGRGSAFAFDPKPVVPLQMGTLSKAVGGYGGYVCATRPVVEMIRNRARSLVYSTALPPSVIAGDLKALELIAAHPEWADAALAKARRLTAKLDLPTAQSCIVPLVLGSAERALAASAALKERGFLVAAIRPPTVPPGTARLRIALSLAHTDEAIDALAEAILSLGLREDAR